MTFPCYYEKPTMARKSPTKCRVFLCTRPTMSGKAEPPETRYCHNHSPKHLEHLARIGKEANARNVRITKGPKTKGPRAKGPGAAPGASPTLSGGACAPAGPRCAFGPSWCPYTRWSHWYWTRTARAKCETWGKLIAGLASRVPFNPWQAMALAATAGRKR